MPAHNYLWKLCLCSAIAVASGVVLLLPGSSNSDDLSAILLVAIVPLSLFLALRFGIKIKFASRQILPRQFRPNDFQPKNI